MNFLKRLFLKCKWNKCQLKALVYIPSCDPTKEMIFTSKTKYCPNCGKKIIKEV